MIRPARPNHQKMIFLAQRRQIWVVCVVILISMLLVGMTSNITKGLASGLVIAYFAQSFFTFVAYHKTGIRARKQVVLYMYLGQMLKWLVTLIGFALVFIMIKPINALAVFVGYGLLQFSYIITIWRLKF